MATNGTNSADNVTAGKPKVGGAVFRAPKGTALPTNATDELDAKFKCLGYCSEDGLSNNSDQSNNKVSAWGGDVVLNMLTAGADTFSLTLIETLNAEVIKAVYGEENVTADESDIAVAVNGGSDEEAVYVFDLILKGGVLKRIVVPCATITSLGEIKYNDTDAVGYAVTLTATNDSKGNSHYEYIHLRSASPASETAEKE
ncbi:phage tail protein [uncultured Ruminococcus sp.]|uniref:phage tail tube protein n=1 Tax=uncultured Ruminococcus sp. TaxID=165186 RepID=UPI0025CDD287|nr:phage tail protein [uncultured Ruminococcus sp.]